MMSLSLLLLLVMSCESYVEIHSPPALAGKYFSPSYIFMGKQGLNFTLDNVSLVMVDPPFGCFAEEVHNADQLMGKVAVVMEGQCLVGVKAHVAKDLGAIGLFVLTEIRNVPFSGYQGDHVEGLEDFPMADLIPMEHYGAFRSEMLAGVPIFASFQPDRSELSNEWIWGPYTGILMSFSLLNIFVASRQLILLSGPNNDWFPKSNLILQLIANTLRIFHCIEPNPIGRGIFPLWFQSIMFTMSWPYSIVATLMIIFYWQQKLLSESWFKDKYLTPARAPWLSKSIAISIILLEHITEVLHALWITDYSFAVHINSIINLVISFATGVYFTAVGIRVLYRLKSQASQQAQAAKKATVMILVSGIGMMIVCAGMLATYATIKNGEPWIVALCEGLIYLGFNMASLSQILSFSINRKVFSSDTEGSSISISSSLSLSESSNSE